MTRDKHAFLSEIAAEHRAREEADWSVTPEEAKELRKNYPADTPEAYRHIDPAEFFDGAR